MSETSIAPYRGGSIINSFDDAARAAKAMAESGFFQDSRNAAQAVVKILAGQEMGFGPFASMNGVFIIQGRPSVGANLMAAAVKKSGRYNYRVIEMTDKACSIDFYEGREKIGTSTFTADDARKAGTKNMEKYPRNMLFARAISNGIRWYCPDVFNGSTVYTPEELGANVNEDGEVIDVPPGAVRLETMPNPVRSEPPDDVPVDERPAPKANGNGKSTARPYAPDTLKEKMAMMAGKVDRDYSQPQDQQWTTAILEQIIGGEGQRKELLNFLFGKTSLSPAKPDTFIGHKNVMALVQWLKPAYDKDSKSFTWDETAEHEAKAAHQHALTLNGQGTLI